MITETPDPWHFGRHLTAAQILELAMPAAETLAKVDSMEILESPPPE